MQRLVTLEIEGHDVADWIKPFERALARLPPGDAPSIPADIVSDGLQSEARREIALWLQTAASVATLILALHTAHHECVSTQPLDSAPRVEVVVETDDRTQVIPLPSEPSKDELVAALGSMPVRRIRLREINDEG